ncbi:Putative disease resistance RPP13-like protein 1 [Striga hermonthica]|uniref:Disease resistance RPP13-like protein 1 n=1 Tax=Striga hermonthica TaxID=68872 RepID=A0A9N7NV23_STRHE|nr:Putative disease resistance RPP13-like protein 1 [Striga hermonthica]
MDSVLQAGIISAPLQVIIDKLTTLTVHEASLIFGVDDQVRKLQRALERTRAIAARVEEDPPLLSGDEARRLWLQDAQALFYSADDLLDEISLDLARNQARLSGAGENEIRNVLFSSFKLAVPREVSRIKQDLDDIAKEMEALYTVGPGLGPERHRRPSTSSLSAVGGPVVGRDKEVDEIVQILLSSENDKTDVIAIAGMAGIGKTSLARAVYDDARLRGFDLKMWAHVSADFDPAHVTRSLVESATGSPCQLSYLDALQARLSSLVQGKRFLTVLDDYWIEKDDDLADWDMLVSPLVWGVSRGSKILVTTRSSGLVEPAIPYLLHGLSDETCWELIRRRACPAQRPVGSSSSSARLEEIGRKIATRCRGSPLAARAVGGMLRCNDSPDRWESVLRSRLWDEADGVFAALAVSYHRLPTRLRKCFAYCSVFPKNHEFEAAELVLMWMAEGFVAPHGKLRSEDIGHGYFEDLVSRSFFQFSHEREGRKIYTMHDTIHWMAQTVSCGSCLRIEDDGFDDDLTDTISRNTRHFLLACRGVQPQRQLAILTGPSLLWYKNLRTFRVIHGGKNTTSGTHVRYELFLRLKVLRVLDLSCAGLDELPDSIDHLKHLRYLDLSDNRFRKLPESVTNLFSLQTLRLERCFRLLELPVSMKNMVSLRHLHLNTRQLSRMPPEFGKLVELQGLPVFPVGRDVGCGVGQLGKMRYLRGSLCVKNLEYVPNLAEAKEAMLHEKPFIDRLDLEWNEPGSNDGATLAGLRPHENLKELNLTNYNGSLLPSWFGEPYHKLSSVHLRGCRHHQILAPLEKLQYLKTLVVERMLDWPHIGIEFLLFPSLECLVIKDVPNLTHWEVHNLSRFPCLRELGIEDCPRLMNLPSLVNTDGLRNLSISRCPEISSLPADGLPGSLQALIISECDGLKDRCRIEEGRDWWMIREVPKIEIDYVEIPMEMRRF